MANEEIIGFHKGSLAVLVKERQELLKMAGTVDQIIKAHIDELKKYGIDLEEEAKKVEMQQMQEKPRSIEKPKKSKTYYNDSGLDDRIG